MLKIRPTLPQGIHIDIYNDRSVMLKSRIELLIKNMGFGLILVSILLAVFLDLKTGFLGDAWHPYLLSGGALDAAAF